MQIELKKNNMQIDGEGIEIFLMNMVLKMKTLKRQKSKKTPYHASSWGSGLNIFYFGTFQWQWGPMTYGT